jgi:hypothetical protein
MKCNSSHSPSPSSPCLAAKTVTVDVCAACKLRCTHVCGAIEQKFHLSQRCAFQAHSSPIRNQYNAVASCNSRCCVALHPFWPVAEKKHKLLSFLSSFSTTHLITISSLIEGRVSSLGECARALQKMEILRHSTLHLFWHLFTHDHMLRTYYPLPPTPAISLKFKCILTSSNVHDNNTHIQHRCHWFAGLLKHEHHKCTKRDSAAASA